LVAGKRRAALGVRRRENRGGRERRPEVNGWQTIRLGDVCRKIGSGATPRGGNETYLKAGPFSLIRSQNVYNNRFTTDGLAFISKEQADDLSNVEVSAGDVLLNITGDSVARCCQAPREVLPARVNQHVAIIRPDPNELDPTFLRYFLVSPQMQEQMLTLAGAGATRNALTKGMIENFDVPKPDITEQRAIASVLGALDDKIELNRRMNGTLEALAQSRFKSWFVDATANGLPKGWRKATLGDLVELHVDCVEPTPAKDNERYIALEDMPSKSIDLSNYQPGSAVNSSIISFRKGDILFGSMRPYFHKVGLAFFDGITRTTTFVLRPKHEHFQHFALFHFFSSEVIEFATTASVGTTIPYIKWEALRRFEIAFPPESCLEQFERAVEPFVQLIAANGEESRTLAALRDALLPKLLSGELRVPSQGFGKAGVPAKLAEARP
jgi:type I restriction enzyme S subunit